jgi:hypothetical protein
MFSPGWRGGVENWGHAFLKALKPYAMWIHYTEDVVSCFVQKYQKSKHRGLAQKAKAFHCLGHFLRSHPLSIISTNVHFVNGFLGIISGQILSCICSVFPPFMSVYCFE